MFEFDQNLKFKILESPNSLTNGGNETSLDSITFHIMKVIATGLVSF
jgi:hypothetical protein